MLPGLKPFSRIWGLDRGTPVDHYYIEQFLSAHAGDIQGHVLEMGDRRYTRKFGAERVHKSDVLHLVPGNPEATIVGDLTTREAIPSSQFDCILIINTFQLIYDLDSAIESCYDGLKPGGILLAHFPGICTICPEDSAWAGDYWRFTSQSVGRLTEKYFLATDVSIKAYGNVLTSAAYLYGIAAEELPAQSLQYHDPNYELVITLRAVKSHSSDQFTS